MKGKKRCFAPFRVDCPCKYCKKARNLIKKSTLKEVLKIIDNIEKEDWDCPKCKSPYWDRDKHGM
jgi:uncharacterized protein with PIN domain